PRSDHAEPTGSRRGHAVSLRDLHTLHGTREGGKAGHPGDRGSRDLAETHRDGGGSAHRVLPRGGVPPGLLPQESHRGLLSRRRRAEGCEVPQAVLGSTEEAIDRRRFTGTLGISFSSRPATLATMKSGRRCTKCGRRWIERVESGREG